MNWLSSKCLNCGQITENYLLKTLVIERKILWWRLGSEFKSTCPECGSDNLEEIGYHVGHDDNGKPVYSPYVPDNY